MDGATLPGSWRPELTCCGGLFLAADSRHITPESLLVAIVVLGAAGLYLLLRDGRDTQPQALRQVGGALAGASLLMLLAFFGMPADWWPASRLTPTLAFAGWTLLSVTSVVAALLTVVTPHVRYAALAFLAMLAANAGLHLLHSQPWVAAGTAGFAAIGLMVFSRTDWPAIEKLASNRTFGFSREPFLACIAAGILVVVLIGTVRFALATEAAAPQDRGPKAGTHPTATVQWGLLNKRSAGDPLPETDRGKSLVAAAVEKHRIALVLTLALAVTTAAGAHSVMRRAR